MQSKRLWLIIDSLKDQINTLQNEIIFLREELKVKNHLLELTITSKKIDSNTTYPSSQKIGHHSQKISDEKKCYSVRLYFCGGEWRISSGPKAKFAKNSKEPISFFKLKITKKCFRR